MNVLTAEQMYELDRRTIESGVPSLDLMRAAGDAVSELVLEMIDTDNTVSVICGKGNNGGDGFRAAEQLALAGVNVTVFLAANRRNIKDEAKTCFDDYIKTNNPFFEILSDDDIHTYVETICNSDIIIDALFGNGLSGDIDGLPGVLIELINASDAQVVAVDIPSGVDASNGLCGKRTVHANHTVTFGCLKVGQIVKPGAFHCGSLHIADIGFSKDVMCELTPYAETLIQPEASDLMPRRLFNSDKFSVGRVFVVAGSVGMTGAAAMASFSALRSGAGLVSLGCPESLNDIIEIKLTEVMTLPLPEVRKKRCLSLRALGKIQQYAQKADVTALGPGIGMYHETSDLVRRFIATYSGRVVLDADGINAFAGNATLLADSPAECVLTPHCGELARLMSLSIDTINADPYEAALLAAKATDSIVLLKGSPSIVAIPSGEVWLNATGNEGMATAGAGDVLTGLIAGLAAQGLSMKHAAILGAFIHGRAGDIAADKMTVPGMIATDVIDIIPAALGSILKKN